MYFLAPTVYQVADVGSRKKTNYDVVRDPPAKPAAVCECGEREDPQGIEQTLKIETGNFHMIFLLRSQDWIIPSHYRCQIIMGDSSPQKGMLCFALPHAACTYHYEGNLGRALQLALGHLLEETL